MYLQVPKDTIVFISGVPGSGKTTVAYELFKNYCDFRIVEETDIIREILRGYRKHLALMGISIPDEITPHNVFLDYATASRQCEVMMNSIIAIVHRQQRNDIPTIINGVHIIPEILYDNMLFSSHIAYVNLFIESEDLLWTLLRNRDPQKYKKEGVPFLYRMNLDLHKQTSLLAKAHPNVLSLNNSRLSSEETLFEVAKFLRTLF